MYLKFRLLGISPVCLRACVIFFLASFFTSVMADGVTIPEDKTVIQFESRIGDVTFAHRKHAEFSSIQCATCHHKLQPADAVILPCHECHLHKSNSPPKAKKIFHTRCTACHKATIADGQDAGPLIQKCKLCHVK